MRVVCTSIYFSLRVGGGAKVVVCKKWTRLRGLLDSFLYASSSLLGSHFHLWDQAMGSPVLPRLMIKCETRRLRIARHSADQ